MMMATGRKTSPCPILFAFYNVDEFEEPYNWIGLSAVNVNSENLRLYAQVCHQNGKCGNFRLLFCRGRHGLVRKCVPHVQHDYFLLCVHVVVKTLNWKFHVVVWLTTSKNCSKVRAARAARLFFPTRPIKFLIYGLVVTVSVVGAKTPY